MHERFILQRSCHARIAHGNAVGTQTLAKRAYGGIVVCNHSHVVPFAGTLQMLGFDLPHHVVELFGCGTVQSCFHAAISGRDASIRIAGRQHFDRHRARYVPHFARTLRQGHVSRFHACDRQAYAGRDKRPIVVMRVLPVRRVLHGLRTIVFACSIQVFDALQSRSHARLCLVEQIFRIRSTERLHGFVGIAHQQQTRPAIMQSLKQGETSQRRILEIVDDQHVWNIGIPYVRHGLGSVDHQL